MFVPGMPFKPHLMFVSKARSLTLSGVPERALDSLGNGQNGALNIRINRCLRVQVRHEIS